MKLKLLVLENVPIFRQLQIEEALLRADSDNWCLFNHGSSRHIVLGTSATPSDFVNLELAKASNVPLVHRFSGGGTVIVDEDTLFVSFILQTKELSFDPYPKPLLEWSGLFYQQALSLPTFEIRENDYTLNDKKIGGNAQYLRKDRLLHHTSFLWDFKPENMDFLLHPEKEPTYRNKRPHGDFLTSLKPHLSKKEFFTKILTQLEKRYEVERALPPEYMPLHRQTTKLIHPSAINM
ncbi:MAG: lipoate--protein ligase family protein [Verrucomicrobia bacterium]|nr:lipoate--protein ligase family protein [Verrucomicrobiota bacterium]